MKFLSALKRVNPSQTVVPVRPSWQYLLFLVRLSNNNKLSSLMENNNAENGDILQILQVLAAKKLQ